MAITKVDFTNDCETQSNEMFSFLQTYANNLFDSIIHPEEGDGKHAMDIECAVNNINGGQTVLSFDYYSRRTSQSKYCTLYVSNGSSSFAWGTSNQSECKYGIATKTGIALVFRAYANCMIVALAKTPDGNTFIFMPKYSSSIATNYGDMYTCKIGVGLSISTSSTPVNTYFSLNTGENSGVGLVPMCTRDSESYSLDLLRVAYSQYIGQIGIITVNDIKYFSNGIIALKDE